MINKIASDISKFGEEATESLLYFSPIGKIISDLKSSDNDVAWLTATLHLIRRFATKNPTQIHFLICRDFLKDIEIDDDEAVHILSRGLLEFMHRLIKSAEYRLHNSYGSQYNSTSKTISYKEYKSPFRVGDGYESFLMPNEEYIPEFRCEKNGRNFMDVILSELLETFGNKGKEASNFILTPPSESYTKYYSSDFSSTHREMAWSLWITKSPAPSIFFQALSFIMPVIWSDRYRKLWKRQNKDTPAVARDPFDAALRPMMNPSKKKTIKTVDSQIGGYDQSGNLLFTAPTMDPRLIETLQKGVNGLGSITGHKILRWQIKEAFTKWSTGSPDMRLIVVEGGYSGIAEKLECSSGRNPSKIREILHAQAYAQFQFPDGSRGNMIVLNELQRYRNGEIARLSITLGPMLCPEFVHNLPQNSNKLLIAIGDLPPLYGSRNIHAKQACLQLLLFKELSDQSDRIAREGAALIPMDKWYQMGSESGLESKQTELVIDHWCQPDLFETFLDRQGDQYTLASYYQQQHNFLVEQGKLRIENSNRGKVSARQRQKNRD